MVVRYMCQVQLIVNETMGRQPCCDKQRVKRGLWTAEEDKKLINFIQTHGHCCWRAVPKLAGLLRCGKSCRMRWTNYLRPDLKRGLLTAAEEQIVIDLHAKLGNRWSKIAAMLPGRTDNEIKNHWNTSIKKKLIKMGIDPATHQPLDDTKAANSQSVTTIEPAKSSDIGDMLSLKEHRQEMMPIHGEVGTSQSTAIIEPAKSSDTGDMQSLQERSQEKSSWKEQNSDACRHDLDPIMNWPLDVDHDLDPIMYSPLDVDLPSDGPWLNYTCSNCDVLGTVADPLPSDGAFDWLVDYQNLGISSLDLVGDSTVHSSNGSGF